MVPVLHDIGATALVPVGVMNTHQRRFADHATRRTTTSLRPWRAVFALALPVVAVACGADSDSSAATTPVTSSEVDTPNNDSQAAAITETGSAVPTGSDDQLGSDYTDDELDRLLSPPSTFQDVAETPDPGPLETASPEAAIDEIQSLLDEASVLGDDTPILDKVEPIDGGPTERVISMREGRRINEAGEAIQLDDAAALACANVEIALTALDDGDIARAAAGLDKAATLAGDSSVAALTPWSAVLEDAAAAVDSPESDVSPLLAYLSACTQGGYEL